MRRMDHMDEVRVRSGGRWIPRDEDDKQRKRKRKRRVRHGNSMYRRKKSTRMDQMIVMVLVAVRLHLCC